MKVYSFQHKGQRNIQEDALYIDPEEKLFMVCDGVGGSSNGNVASKLVIDTIVKHYEESSAELNNQSIKYYINESMHRISRVAEEDHTFDGMATTISLLYLNGNKAITAHVGDSRVYHIKNSAEWSVTKDHSLVRELYDAGILKTEDEMARHPFRNKITKAIKASVKQTEIDPEITTINGVGSNELFIICTDGVLENYQNEQLVEYFTNETMKLRSLWDNFREDCLRHSIDNNTCILVNT